MPIARMDIPAVVNQLNSEAFYGERNPDIDYHPTTDQDPHYWAKKARHSQPFFDLSRLLQIRAAPRRKFTNFCAAKRRRTGKKSGVEFEALRFHANWIAINIGEGHKIGYSD